MQSTAPHFARLTAALLACAVLVTAAPAFADPSADALAERMAQATGDPYAVSELRFTFVVRREGAEVARRSHQWLPGAGVVVVTSGGTAVRLDVSSADPSPWTSDPDAHAAEWSAVAPGVAPADAAEAWTAFINDSFWLLAPAKLGQPGTERSLEGDDTLVVHYGSGGVTPGDTYRFTVDPETALVTRWEFVLGSGREGHSRWERYETFGPLTLSLLRTSDDGSFAIELVDVAVEP